MHLHPTVSNDYARADLDIKLRRAEAVRQTRLARGPRPLPAWIARLKRAGRPAPALPAIRTAEVAELPRRS